MPYQYNISINRYYAIWWLYERKYLLVSKYLQEITFTKHCDWNVCHACVHEQNMWTRNIIADYVSFYPASHGDSQGQHRQGAAMSDETDPQHRHHHPAEGGGWRHRYRSWPAGEEGECLIVRSAIVRGLSEMSVLGCNGSEIECLCVRLYRTAPDVCVRLYRTALGGCVLGCTALH